MKSDILDDITLFNKGTEHSRRNKMNRKKKNIFIEILERSFF